jgi:hypothetical protein
MIDHLRLTGDYVSLRRRAQAKMSALDGQIDASRHPVGADMQIALEWYFERHSLPMPRVTADYANAAGWSDDLEFRHNVWQDFVFEKRRS